MRLVTFAPILKHGLFPLAELLDALLRMAVEGTGVPVEIEFAAHLQPSTSPEFGVLQLRPLGRVRDVHELDLPRVERERLICASDAVLGHGTIDDVRDLVVIDVNRFDRLKTRDIAEPSRSSTPS